MDIDWLRLWQELVNFNLHTSDSESLKRYKAHALQKRQRPDPLLDFILNSIDSKETVLDIGAGDGRWTIPLAGVAQTVTAIEPSGDMLDIMRENIKTAGVNVQIVQSSWEEAAIEVHDIVVCAHAMYFSPDFASFVHKIEQKARKACYLAMRLPPADGVLGELCNAIYDRSFDSANALIAYNALYSLGVYANVMVEKEIFPWVNDTLEEAFLRSKRHLHLESNSAHDGLIRDTLAKRLRLENNIYVWPDGMRSALLWWNT